MRGYDKKTVVIKSTNRELNLNILLKYMKGVKAVFLENKITQNIWLHHLTILVMPSLA